MKLNWIEYRLMNNPIRAFVQENYEIPSFLDGEKVMDKPKVLEIGCGNGFGAYLINKYFLPSHITGIDLDDKMVALAKSKYPQFSFEQGNVVHLKFPDQSFDAIFDFGIIHHIPDWKTALSELHRVLKKGGRIFIEDFSIESFQSPLGKLLKKLLAHPYTDMLNKNDFFDHFEKLGFTVTKKGVRMPLGLMEYFILTGTR